MSLDIWLTVKTGKNNRESLTIFDGNITGNLCDMWQEAGILDTLYDSGGKKAEEMLPSLVSGITKMRKDPKHYKQFDSPNGWGTYEDGLKFVRSLARACNRFPESVVGIWK